MLIDLLRAHPRLAELLDSGLVRAAVPFQIDEVVRYVDHLFAAETARMWHFERDLPNVAPLAPVTWLEWTYPFEWAEWATATGLLLQCALDCHDPDLQRALADEVAAGRIAGDVFDGVRWCYHARIVVRTADHRLAVSPYTTLVWVAPDGRVDKVQAEDATTGAPVSQDADDCVQIVSLVCCGLMAVCFAHCKGVIMTDHQQPRQQRRAAEREGRPALVTYKTIDIAPVTRILHDEGQVEKVGLKKALHIVRGHFAHYAPGHYFGRNTEPVTVFRPLHVRGTLEAGAVVKDYRVLTGDRDHP